MSLLRTLSRSAHRVAYSVAALSALHANPASSELFQVDIVGTVFFEGCPYSGTCWQYPLMWGVTGGEAMTMRVLYDDALPISEDSSNEGYYAAYYDHAIPLEAPFGIDVTFGPYSARVGSHVAGVDRYSIDLFDVIPPNPSYPDLSEAIGINIDVSPRSLILQGPPGLHDLELRGIHYGLRNFYGHDFLNGTSLPRRFPELEWDDILLMVEVYDPIYRQSGNAFLKIDSLTLTALPDGVPSLSIGGAILLASGLVLAARRRLRKAT